MPTIAPEAEKISASTFKWITNDTLFTTKTDISTRNLRVNDNKVDRESELKNLGKILTAKTPKEVEETRKTTKSLDPVAYEVRSSKLIRGGVNGREGTSSKNNYYSFGERGDNVMYRQNSNHLTEKNYDRICCEVEPINTATTSSSRKLQDWSIIHETTASQRGGLDTRNYIKDTLAPSYPSQKFPKREIYS
tara:strand:- start:7040 stop:7615 length:576 start_codon:yes stop_codon:yes gene_type:complete